MAVTTRRYVHEISEKGNLYFLLNAFIGAINKFGDAAIRLADRTTPGGNNTQILTAINNLTGKVDTMSSNIDRIEREAADAAENVSLVRTALEGLKSTVSDLQTMVSDLQEQVAQGQVDQSRLDAAAATLEKADEDLDALVLPAAPPAEGGGEGDGENPPA